MDSSWKLAFRLSVAGLAAGGMLAAGVPLAAAGEEPESGPQTAPAVAAEGTAGTETGAGTVTGTLSGTAGVEDLAGAGDPGEPVPSGGAAETGKPPAAAGEQPEAGAATEPDAGDQADPGEAVEPVDAIEAEPADTVQDEAEPGDAVEDEDETEPGDTVEDEDETEPGDAVEDEEDGEGDATEDPEDSGCTPFAGRAGDGCAQLVVYKKWIVNGQEVANGTTFNGVRFDAALALASTAGGGSGPAAVDPAVWGLLYPVAHDSDIDIVDASSVPDFCGAVGRVNSGYRVQEDGDLQDLSWRDGDTLHIQGGDDYAVTITSTVDCIFPPVEQVPEVPQPQPAPDPVPGPSVPADIVVSRRPVPAVVPAAVPVSVDQDGLPATGADAGWVASAGGLLLAAGTGTIWANRRALAAKRLRRSH